MASQRKKVPNQSHRLAMIKLIRRCAVNFKSDSINTFNAALLAVNPAADVETPIFPHEFSFAVSLVLLEFADILLLVGPDQVALAVHFVVQPLSIVFLAV